MGIQIHGNQVIIDWEHSSTRSAEYYSLAFNKFYYIPIGLLHRVLNSVRTMVMNKTRHRIEYKTIIPISVLQRRGISRNGMVVFYEVSYSNSRTSFITKYIVDLNRQKIYNLYVKDYHGLKVCVYKCGSRSIAHSSLLKLKIYGPGMINVIRQAISNILSIGLNIHGNMLYNLIYKSYGLDRAIFRINNSYNGKNRSKAFYKALQELHEVYVLMLLGISHYHFSGQVVKTIAHCTSDGCDWVLRIGSIVPSCIIETPKGNYYTIWYQLKLLPYECNRKKTLLYPDIVIFKGQYNNYDSLFSSTNIDEIILIDAKIRYNGNDHTNLICYVKTLKAYFNPKRLIVVLPFLEDTASSIKGGVNPYQLASLVGKNNFHVIEDVRPGGAGDLEFMKIIYSLMP
ncbi:MAG: hypothetical protein B6U89_05720 [Desulfurococcales archaeon ex4484_58]|nr:MAG: hypothetical protein B6U89_05720 [Desulfurococcales archaeon ex4484_58]